MKKKIIIRLIAFALCIIAAEAFYHSGVVLQNPGNNPYLFGLHAFLLIGLLCFIPILICGEVGKTFLLYSLELIACFVIAVYARGNAHTSSLLGIDLTIMLGTSIIMMIISAFHGD